VSLHLPNGSTPGGGLVLPNRQQRRAGGVPRRHPLELLADDLERQTRELRAQRDAVQLEAHDLTEPAMRDQLWWQEGLRRLEGPDGSSVTELVYRLGCDLPCHHPVHPHQALGAYLQPETGTVVCPICDDG
jgi:hypothetical protein